MSGHTTGRRVRSDAARRRRAAKKWNKGHGYGATKRQTGEQWLHEEQRSTAEVVRAYQRGLPIEMPRLPDRSRQSSWWSDQRWSWNSPAEVGRAWWQTWWQSADWGHDVQDDATATWAEDTWYTGAQAAESGWSRSSQHRWRQRSEAWEQRAQSGLQRPHESD